MAQKKISQLSQRPRRLRRRQVMRDVVADVTLTPDNLIYPLFVSAAAKPKPVPSMPGIQQLPVSSAVSEIQRLSGLGLKQFILFGVTPASKKDATGSYAADPAAPVNRVLSEVASGGAASGGAASGGGSGGVLMYADLCFCEYTDHGHCGVLAQDDPHWVVDNGRTLQALGRTAVAQAKAGAAVVAPSGMMDGQVGAIRAALDDAGYPHVAILSYAVKFASSLYGPFRDAGEGGMKFGDRRGYQMDYRRCREWRTELEADIAQGADMVMVKPALAYLDIIHQVRSACSLPVAAYHVSGEYSMLHAAAQRGWLDLKQAVLEHTYAIRRAGADLILTYFAPQLAEWL